MLENEGQQVETTEQPPQEAPQVPETEPKAEETASEPQAEAKEEADQPRDEKGRFKGVQDRINELTRARREAEREAAYWRELANQGQQKAPEPAPKPTADKFGSYDEYVEALADWKAEQKVSEALAKQSKQSAEVAQRRAEEAQVQTWAQRQESARQALPDYDEVLGSADVGIARHVEQTILDSERGPEVAYHLAKNPDIVRALNSMSPLAAAREIGKLEAGLNLKPTPKPVSKAPEPIKPINSGRSAQPDLTSVSMEEYMKLRAKQGASWARR